MYDEKYVRRGEIYSIRSGEYDDPTGSLSRPGLIISNNNSNSSKHNTVIVAMLTTRDYDIGFHYGPIMNTGRASYVCCENIATVAKNRIGKLMGSLSENQMKEVESRLDEVLDLGYVDDAPLKEKELEIEALRLQLDELKTKNAELQKKIEAHTDELVTRDVEIAVHKRMYEKAVGIIAAMRAEPDMPENPRFPKKKPEELVEEPKKPEPPKNPDPPKPKMPDINSATFSQLRSVGFTNSQVLATINGRPYKTLEDLKNTPGINGKAYYILSKRVCCVPVKEESVEEPKPTEEEVVETPEITETPSQPKKEKPVWDGVKVNINKVETATELSQKTGLNMRTCQEILKHRHTFGDYEKVEDLTNLKNFGGTCMKRYGHMLEV